MSILSAIRQQSGSIDDLAKLPQALIMQMAQRKQISAEMVAPILARKADMIDAAAKMRAMKAGSPQNSVMEQLIAQNSVAEQPIEDTGVAQIPIPEREYAGGGIIAFAKGDLIDEDDEIDVFDDYARATSAARQSNAMPSFMAGEEPARAQRAVEASVKPEITKRSGHKYENDVIKEAERLGVDPSLALHVLYKETGNLKNPESARSSAGAIGVMQLMPKTAKGLGVDPMNPEENIRGGVTYLKQMYDRYQDPTLALAAYNAGPGRLDKALKSGEGISGLSRETQNYVLAGRMAEGGEVRHFVNDGYVDSMSGLTGAFSAYGNQDEDMDALRIEEIMKTRKLKEDQERYEFLKKSAPEMAKKIAPPAKAVSTAPVAKKSTEPSAQDFREFDQAQALFEAEAIPKNVTPETVKEKTMTELFLEQNAADRDALKGQRSEDRNMALLAAGLGMLGGESPYAFSNIGKGGLAGVSYLSDANKQRAAQQAALDKNRITAMHYGNVGDYYKGQTLSKEDRTAMQKAQLAEKTISTAKDDLVQLEKMLDKEFKERYPVESISQNDPKTLQLRRDFYAPYQARLNSLQATGFPNLPTIAPPASTAGFKIVK